MNGEGERGDGDAQEGLPPVRVHSEVGRLRRVLVHAPGPEVDQMVPSMMEELLFDDILFGDRAREEHAVFRRVLARAGVEVIEALDLLGEALELDPARKWLEARVLPRLLPEFRERLQAMGPGEVAAALVGGLPRHGTAPVESLDDLFGIRPLPNWCFQRDTQVVLGSEVLLSAMANDARHREALLTGTIFRFHPSLAPIPLLADLAEEQGGAPGSGGSGAGRLCLEGGDVLVLSPDLVAVGHSERTGVAGIERLVQALHRRAGGPRWLLRVELPRERAFMHLDTLFTPVDRDMALVYPPVILPGFPHSARVLEYDLHSASPAPVESGDLLAALSRRGLDFDPVPCGGSDPMDQQREQWTDGANALALAPGVIVLYARNVRTARELDRRGFQVAAAEDFLQEGAPEFQPDGKRSCILIPSGEMSRARGGPHCLTHPLLRDAL